MTTQGSQAGIGVVLLLFLSLILGACNLAVQRPTAPAEPVEPVEEVVGEYPAQARPGAEGHSLVIEPGRHAFAQL